MINAYHSIIHSNDFDFEEYLTKIHLINIFKPALEEFPDKELFKGVVKFIVYGYSMDSEMLLTSGNSWINVYKEIYEASGLPDNGEIFDLVANLGSDGVRESIERWLQWGNNEAWTQFIHFRDLRRQFLSLSLKALKKSTGEVDIQAKMDAATYSNDLLKMMEDAKETFIQNHPKLKASVDVLNKANKNKVTRSVADYAQQ